MRAVTNQAACSLYWHHVPMPRNIPEPADAGGFERDGWVEAAGHGALDDGLLLLVEQRDHLPFRPDRQLQLAVRPAQKSDNRRLLIGRRHKHGNLPHTSNGQIPLTNSNTVRRLPKVSNIGFAA